MTARKKFDTLRAQVDASPERRQRVNSYKLVMDLVSSLANTRRARRLTQVSVAQALHVSQPVVSQIEHSTELTITTLNRYVTALGARLEITAVFEDGRVALTNGGPDDTFAAAV